MDDSVENEIKQIMLAMGSMAEMCYVFFKASLASGFTESQAMTLTISMLNNLQKPKPEDEK